MYDAGEDTFDAMHAAMVISRGRRRGLDIAKVCSLVGPGQIKVVPSFLCVEWALIADIDIESEAYRRCCGGERFTVSALQRIACLRRYKGRLSIMPDTSGNGDSSSTVYGANQRPLQRPLNPTHTSVSAAGPYTRAGPFSRDAFFGQSGEGGTVDHDSGTTTSAAVPALSDPVPDDWIVLEGTFTLVWACNTSHQTADSHLYKGAQLDDGRMQVAVVQEASRCSLLQGFVDEAAAQRIYQLYTTRAYRLEPLQVNLMKESRVKESHPPRPHACLPYPSECPGFRTRGSLRLTAK
jgi:sphingosine kinase